MTSINTLPIGISTPLMDSKSSTLVQSCNPKTGERYIKGVNLYPHQLAAVSASIDLERNGYIVTTRDDYKNQSEDISYLQYKNKPNGGFIPVVTKVQEMGIYKNLFVDFKFDFICLQGNFPRFAFPLGSGKSYAMI